MQKLPEQNPNKPSQNACDFEKWCYRGFKNPSKTRQGPAPLALQTRGKAGKNRPPAQKFLSHPQPHLTGVKAPIPLMCRHKSDYKKYFLSTVYNHLLPLSSPLSLLAFACLVIFYVIIFLAFLGNFARFLTFSRASARFRAPARTLGGLLRRSGRLLRHSWVYIYVILCIGGVLPL